jgi:hypothetical protein
VAASVVEPRPRWPASERERVSSSVSPRSWAT